MEQPDKLAWVSGVETTAHPEGRGKAVRVPPAVREDMFDRIEQALRQRRCRRRAGAATRTGRLFILSEDDPRADSTASLAPICRSNISCRRTRGMVTRTKLSLMTSRSSSQSARGGVRCGYETSGGWVAITKDFLTEVLGRARREDRWAAGAAAQVFAD